jgi:hypothetical protein
MYVIASNVSEMALPYETMTEEARRLQRQEKISKMEMWDKNTQAKRFYYEAGKAAAADGELFEDALLAVNALDGVDKAAIQALLRRGALQAKKAWKRAEMASKLGLNAIDKVYNRVGDLQDLDEEEAKLVKEYLKEVGKNDGGGKAKKKEDTPKPYDRGEGSAAAQAAPGMGFGWGMGQQFPMNVGMGGMSGMGFSGMAAAGWPGMMMMQPGILQGVGMAMQQGPAQYGNMQYGNAQQSDNSAGSYGGGGGQGGAVQQKRKHPCDNCGAMGHWKYQPVCPNFHIHLAQQQAKHVAAQQAAAGQAGQQGAAAAAGEGSTALVPRNNTGKKGN